MIGGIDCPAARFIIPAAASLRRLPDSSNTLTDSPDSRAPAGDPAVPAWRAVAAFLAGTLFFGLAFVHRVAPSVMTSELMRDFAVGGAALGTLSAWYFYTYASIQIPVGMLNDRFGPRRLMTAAVAVCALASFGFAASESLIAASFIAVLRNPQSWACAGIGFGMTAIMLAFAGLWAPKWLRDVYGYAEVQSGAVVSMLFLGWAIGAPLMGWLSDYTGRRKPVLLIGIICNSILFALILFAGTSAPGTLSVLFFLLGVSGSMMTIAFGCMRELNPPKYGSTAMGLVNMCVVGSGAVMQPVIGWLLDLQWRGALEAGARVYESGVYTNAFTVLFASNALALACVVLLRETYCKQVVGDGVPPRHPRSVLSGGGGGDGVDGTRG